MKTKSALFPFLLVPVLTIFAATAIAQGTIPAGGGVSTEPRPDSIQDTGYWGYMANAPGGVVAGGILQGKVVLAGNPLLWEPLTVMLSCTPGKPSLTTQTGADGSYAITHVNLPKAYTTEDDALSIQMSQHYEGCTLQAPLAGYHFEFHHDYAKESAGQAGAGQHCADAGRACAGDGDQHRRGVGLAGGGEGIRQGA